MPHNLNIVLVEPEIPMNTGTIGRLCLATGAALHLIEPLGFEINDTKLKRAGLDYWKFVNFKIYPNLNNFLQKIQPDTPKIFLSTKGQSEFFEHSFQENSYIFFGSETRGLPKSLLESNQEATFRIPQYDDRIRSINIANAVGIVIYEAIRQLGYK
jgi:tRNA (cytidine/uridine-2'-O-)-methyltransferase